MNDTRFYCNVSFYIIFVRMTRWLVVVVVAAIDLSDAILFTSCIVFSLFHKTRKKSFFCIVWR